MLIFNPRLSAQNRCTCFQLNSMIRMDYRRIVFVLILYVTMCADALGQQTPVNQSSEQLTIINAFPGLRFSQPLLLTNAGDGSDRVFVVEKTGAVHVFENNREVTSTRLFLDISDRILPPGHPDVGETGLLSMTFHPQYANNGRLYISYVDENLVSVISELQVSDDPFLVDKSTERILLSMQQPQRNHNAGHVAFGPDGLLYIAFGDGFSESSRDGITSGDPLGHGQNLETWFSSVLRIDVDQQQDSLQYAIPPDNPFVGNEEGWKEEIFAYGFRNPWRFSFDREEGTLLLADVGDKKAEEINIVTSGNNYGWSLKEASHCFEDVPCDTTQWVDLTDPIFEYLRDVGESVTGGYVYNGSKFPDLKGKYIYGDYDFGTIWALELENEMVLSNEVLVSNVGRISSFGEDEAGELYIVDFTGDIRTFEEPSTTSTERPDEIPPPFAIQQNYPNPFSGETHLMFEVSSPGSIAISIYDLTGKKVRTFNDRYYTPGQYAISWNGLDNAGRAVSPGVYLYVLETNGLRKSGTMVSMGRSR